MEIKVEGIQPHLNVKDEGSAGNQQGLNDHSLLKPVEKTENNNYQELKKDGKEAKQGARDHKEKLDPEAVKQIVEETKAMFEGLSNPVDLNIQVDDKTGEIVVQIFNQETEELIRQIPSDEVLKIRERMKEFRGVLCDEKI